LYAPALLAERYDAGGYASVLLTWAVLMAGAITVVALVGTAAWLNNRNNARRAATLEVDVWRSGPPMAGAAAALPATPAPPAPPRPRPPTREDCERLRAEAEELRAIAAAADMAARRAVAAAAEARARYQHIQQAREAAWQAIESAQHAYEAAQQAFEAERRAAASATTAEASVAADAPAADGPSAFAGDDVEREVSRAAYGAYRRGDISIDQLQEVVRRASGWDAEQEQHEHRVTQLRARERAARRRYYGFAASERTARKAADVASVAAQALVDEAAEAAAEARAARQVLQECFARTSGRGRGSRR